MAKPELKIVSEVSKLRLDTKKTLEDAITEEYDIVVICGIKNNQSYIKTSVLSNRFTVMGMLLDSIIELGK